METELCVGQQKVRFDRDATAALYRDTITAPNADECGCISCKNFAAQRSKAYPEEFLQFLMELGVDPLKEWEVFDYEFTENSRGHLYGGWFVFSGELVEGLNKPPEDEQEAFTHWFTASFPTGRLPKDRKFCAVEFLVKLPWILPEMPQSSTNTDLR